MKIRFDLTMDDLLAFNRYHFMNSPAYRSSLIVGMAMVSILPLGLTLFLIYNGRLPRLPVIAFGCGLTLFSMFGFYRRFPSAIDRTTRRMFGNDQSLFGPHELEIEDEWLVERTDINASRQAWRGIQKIVETDDYVFIYLSAATAHVIPKAAVTSGDLPAFMTRARDLQAAAQMATA